MAVRRAPKKIDAYRHETLTPPQAADPAPGNYYVSVVDGGRLGLLLGPFAEHRRAIDAVPHARAKAEELDAWAVFYKFGTVRMRDSYRAPGALNNFLPEWGP